MANYSKDKVIKEITPLSEKDFFYIADRVKREFTYPIHSHSDYELNFTENAAGVKRIVGDSVEVIGDYDLVLVSSKELEHVLEQHECKSPKIREITIQFSPDIFEQNFTNKQQFDSIRKMLVKGQKGIAFPMSAIMKVYPLLDSLSMEQDSFYAVMKFFTILYELSKCKEAKTLSSSPFARIDTHSESRRVQNIQQYINENYKQDIRLPVLAQMAGMSAVAFSRFFKARTGTSLSDYIIDVRLGHASQMLVQSGTPVADICLECGFNNLSNFNRIFKKKKGCSPQEYRKQFKKKDL
ncbi:MAG: helix-turn-helix domain-containing protein [Bacteroidales bacterium]|jgi:AraC-like DNA-binding protein|nr:helix-turn-helix domain-containing protein [Bacteroidales bacterium]